MSLRNARGENDYFKLFWDEAEYMVAAPFSYVNIFFQYSTVHNYRPKVSMFLAVEKSSFIVTKNRIHR
jgi:hypothetical protein